MNSGSRLPPEIPPTPAPELPNEVAANSSSGTSSSQSAPESFLWLKQSDQIFLGVLGSVILILIGIHWWRLSGHGLQPVQVQRAPVLPIMNAPLDSPPRTFRPSSLPDTSEEFSTGIPPQTAGTVIIHETRRPSFSDYQFRVNPNTASWVELDQLPGIGETLAKRIIQDREAYGPFHNLHDLMRVRGIGQKTFDKMRPALTLE